MNDLHLINIANQLARIATALETINERMEENEND